MIWVQQCIYCNGKIYRLADNRIKCSKCLSKFSLEKTNRIFALIDFFSNDESALSVSKRAFISYATVQKHYNFFRLLCAKISESEYENKKLNSPEFAEYFYLEKSKKNKTSKLYDSYNFLTFFYDNAIYNLLMPSVKQYKPFSEDSSEKKEQREFKKFQRKTQVVKIDSTKDNIENFWLFFEDSITKYKGVQADNFPYFLKEIEFKYNHSVEQRKTLLMQHYFRDEI